MGQAQTKKNWVVMLALLTLLLTAVTPCWADPEWVEGQITAGPQSDKVRFLGVDGVKYMVMPDAPVWQSRKNVGESYSEAPYPFKQLRVGQSVRIWREGSRIYQIVVIIK